MPVSVKPKWSFSQLLNVTNSDWLADMRQNMPAATIHPRRVMRPEPAAPPFGVPLSGRVVGHGARDDAGERQHGDGADHVADPPTGGRGDEPHGGDADQQAERPRRLGEPDHPAALRSYGTRSDIQAARPRSNITLLCEMTTSASANTSRLVLDAASAAPNDTPTSPADIAVRRCSRSATRPVSGDSSPDSSLIASATPMRSSDTPCPAAMVARNGGREPEAGVRGQPGAAVSVVMCWRTSAGYESSRARCSTAFDANRPGQPGGHSGPPVASLSDPWP